MQLLWLYCYMLFVDDVDDGGDGGGDDDDDDDALIYFLFIHYICPWYKMAW